MSILQANARDHGLPSISASFSVSNFLIWSGAIGLASIETGQPAKVTNLYRAGSVSKAITSLIAVRLVDRGILNLDRPINQYLGNYRNGDHITSRMLGSHTAGIRHYQYSFGNWPPNEFFMNKQFDTVEESLRIFNHDDLLFEPGTGFSYSSYGYSLLSFVLERASGRSFSQLLREEIVEPLQLSDTRLDVASLDNSDQTQYYDVKDKKWRPTRTVNLSSKWAGGGVVSTPTDLVKIGLSIQDERYISPEAQNILVKPTYKDHDAGALAGYSFGWITNSKRNLLTEDKYVTTYSHAGSSVGADSNLLVIPAFGVVVAVQINRSPRQGSTSAELLSDDIGRLILAKLT
jgi:CubicO group peptidase (beta-lactamase class C family)